jgi:N-acetyl-gamma-glutamyl-phosphate reductase/acetylglutamate kinase
MFPDVKRFVCWPLQDVGEVESIVRGFEAKGRLPRAYLPISYSKPASSSPASSSGATRSFSSWAWRPAAATPASSPRRGYATAAGTTKKVGLIGARGYTGSNLVSLLNGHPSLSLSHVSSRELAGQKLAGYNKADVTYENLGVEQVKEIEESGEVDAWVMALPNGVCKPFVDAIDSAEGGKSAIVDLSADMRFEDSWTYGLPGER